MGMATPEEVNTDLKVVREALGLEDCANESAEAEALTEVEATLKPVLDQTWHTGRKGNRT